MKKELEISQTFVSKNLSENKILYPDIKDKLAYFCMHISLGYREYNRNRNESAGHKSIEEFAKEVIAIHNKKFESLVGEIKANYYKQPQHIEKIIKDYTASLISKNNPDHLFTNVNPIDDPRVDRLKEIINGYICLINKDKSPELLKIHAKRILIQFVSGVRLLSVNHYADSFIIWRSLLESVSYFKIVIGGSSKTSSMFIERKDSTKKILGMVTTTKAEMNSINTQIENRKIGKKASWWEKQRFSWAKNALIGKELSSKSIQEAAKMGKFYPHYQVASIFTHEYLIDEDDFKTIKLLDYLINLYWRVFEEIRIDIIDIFKLEELNVQPIRKHEETMRKLLKNTREAFTNFSNMIGE